MSRRKVTPRNLDTPAVSRVTSVPARHVRPTATIRGALIAGFVVILGLWALSGYELVRRLRDVEQRTAAEQQAALRGERVLSTVRTNVLLGSIYLRDALIDNRAVTQQYYRDELNEIRGNVERMLPAYLADVGSGEERRHWEELQGQLQEYWKSREMVLLPDAPLSTSDAAAILRRRVVPSRETILQIVERISALQALSQRRHEAEISALYAELRERLLLIGTLALALGMGVALFATQRVGGLEHQIERQRLAERHTKHELERLSARLVTVQEEEKRSLARELHDEVGQALTAIKMDVAVALRGVDTTSRERSALEDARVIAENTLQSVRDLSQLLHPSTLDDFGLPETVGANLSGFGKRTGIATELVQAGRIDERLPPDVEVCVYRIVQEALTNVARHSGARHVRVTLDRSDEMLTLVVEDNGRGVEMTTAMDGTTGGLGLVGMRERAQAVGGSFAVRSRPGEGTRIEARVPVRPALRAIQRGRDLLAG
jgi:signal transduction histidine kinase